MVLDVVRKGSNLLLKTKRISLRLYRVRIRSCQKGFPFDRFVQRGVVLLVLVLVWWVLQVGLLLVWVRVSCCGGASLLRWVLPQRLCIPVLIRWFRGQILRAEMFLVGVQLFLVHDMFLVWIVPSFVCFLRYTKLVCKTLEFQCFVTTRRSGSLVTSCCDTTVRRIGS